MLVDSFGGVITRESQFHYYHAEAEKKIAYTISTLPPYPTSHLIIIKDSDCTAITLLNENLPDLEIIQKVAANCQQNLLFAVL